MSDRDEKYAERRENLEDISLIWFCTDDALPTISSQFEAKLHDINDSVRFFTNELSLMNYLESVRHEVVVLILDATSQNMQTISQLIKTSEVQRQTNSIVLFCNDEHFLPNDDWSTIHIYHNEEQLMEGLTNDIQALQQSSVDTRDEDSMPQKIIRELITESPGFLCLHLFKDVVINMSDREVAKQVMLDFCRNRYAKSPAQLQITNRFEHTYKPTDAICWYTKSTFLFRLINKALRTENVELLYMFRFYIADLCAHLRMLKEEQQQLHNQKPSNIHRMTVYRGTRVSLQCIQTLQTNLKRIVSINGFVSTSRDKKIARNFAGNGFTHTDGRTESIIFEIQANTSLTDVIAADISHLSKSPTELEVLFDIGTTFLVKTLTYDEKMALWECTLEATEDGAQLVRDHVKFYDNEMQGISSDVRFAGLLIDMCLQDKAESQLQKLLANTNRTDIAHIHFQFGRINYCESSQASALQHLHIARLMEKEPINVAAIMMKIGLNLYFNKNVTEDDYREEIYWNECAFEIYEAYDRTDSYNASYCLNNIGFALHKLGEYPKALGFHERALEIRRRVLPPNHSLIAQSLRNVGLAFLEVGDHEKALHAHMDALDIVNQSVPEIHWSRASTLRNLGVIYYRTGDLPNSLSHFQLALNIYERAYKGDHSEIIRTRNLLKCAQEGSVLPSY